MSRTCRRLPPALLALALLLSAAAEARAQGSTTTEPRALAGALFTADSPPKSVEDEKAVGTKIQQPQPDAQAGGTPQQPQPQPTPSAGRAAPLTAEQKIRRAFRGAFLSPVPYATAAFNGGIRQIGEDRLPHKDGGDEVADWGSHTARVFATGTTYRIFGNGFYPALFRQDPRYERSQSKKLGSRLGHAVSRLFVTRGDNGNLQPNFSRFAGAATSSALANVWERSTPGHDRIGPDATLRRFGMSFVSGAIGNIVREFASDIF